MKLLTTLLTTLFFASCLGAACDETHTPGPAKGAALPTTPDQPVVTGEPAVEDAPVVASSGGDEVDADAPPAQPAKRQVVILSVKFVPVDVDKAEDGLGKDIKARDPVAMDIAAEHWPTRALDPVLHLGELSFKHYTFPELNVIRYTVADRSVLKDGVGVYVQYGDDEASRVTVTESLEVPR